jgi:hypothetical protein
MSRAMLVYMMSDTSSPLSLALTPLIPLSPTGRGEGEIIKERGEAPLKRPHHQVSKRSFAPLF